MDQKVNLCHHLGLRQSIFSIGNVLNTYTFLLGIPVGIIYTKKPISLQKIEKEQLYPTNISHFFKKPNQEQKSSKNFTLMTQAEHAPFLYIA